MSSLGQNLRRERELRGISLQEIASSTKISLRFLEALEEDRQDILPGKFFIKAILRTYASFLGLEEDTFLNKYYEESLLEEQSRLARRGPENEEKGHSKRVRIIGGTAFLAVFCGLLFVIFNPLKKEEAPAFEELQVSALLEKKTPASLPVTDHFSEPFSEQSGMSLEVFFTEETWIQIFSDGEIKVDGLKEPGETLTLKAREEFLIHVGNAGGLTYRINQKKGRPLGSSGVTIRNLRISADNYRKFLEEEAIHQP